MLQKASRKIDAELRSATLTIGAGLDSLTKKHGIYDGSIHDFRSRRPQEWLGAHDARGKLTIVSLKQQSIGQQHHQEKDLPRRLMSRG